MTRFAKQLLFGGIYLAIVFGIVTGGYRLFTVEPTCGTASERQEEGLELRSGCGVLSAPVKPLAEPRFR